MASRRVAPEAARIAQNITKTKDSISVPPKRSRALQDTFSVGERVKTVATVKPKKFAGLRGEIEDVNEGEFCVAGGWFVASEIERI